MAKIEVVIKDQTGQQSVNVPSTPKAQGTTPQDVDKKAKQSKDNQKSAALSAVAVMAVQKTASYVTSNVGKWTGNSRNQTKVNNVMKLGGYAAMAYANPYLAIAAVALEVGTQAIDYSFERYWDTKQAQQRQARTGGKGGYRR
jgi:hypothetical protein